MQAKKLYSSVMLRRSRAKELPELDDDFAKDVSEFDTLAEYKENVKKEPDREKRNRSKNCKRERS